MSSSKADVKSAHTILNKTWISSYALAASVCCNLLLLVLCIHYRNLSFTKLETYPLTFGRADELNPDDLIINFIPLRKAVRDYVTANNDTIGVYFEYLPTGVSIGANDREEVHLASLAKVPLVMSVMKKVEEGRLSLNDSISLKKEDLDDGFGNLYKAGVGARFTVRELVEHSLRESDNTAYNALFDLLSDKEVMDVYDNLEVEVESPETSPTVSPKSYSSIFRSLYLSSYLSGKDSNYILDLLTTTDFKDKIPSGVPATVPVAHKIGVYNTLANDAEVYTDCGIVYVPNRPYMLCIFVQDTDTVATKHISMISKMIYSYVSRIQGGNKEE